MSFGSFKPNPPPAAAANELALEVASWFMNRDTSDWVWLGGINLVVAVYRVGSIRLITTPISIAIPTTFAISPLWRANSERVPIKMAPGVALVPSEDSSPSDRVADWPV